MLMTAMVFVVVGALAVVVVIVESVKMGLIMMFPMSRGGGSGKARMVIAMKLRQQFLWLCGGSLGFLVRNSEENLQEMGKRGRPRKEIEDDGDSDALYSPPQEFLSAPQHNLRPRYQTRAKARFGQCSAYATPLRSPIRIVKGISCQSSTLRRPSKVSKSAAASSSHSNHHADGSPSHTSAPKLVKRGATENPELVNYFIPTANNLLDMENTTLEFLGQTQDSEAFVPDASRFAAHEVVPKTHLSRRGSNSGSEIIRCSNKETANDHNLASEINRNRAEETANNPSQNNKQTSQISSFNITEFAAMLGDDSDADEVASAADSALVTVNGYRVKIEMAPLLRSIFLKRGDIARASIFQSPTARSNALEMLCGIYQKLENAEFKYVTLVELESMLGVVQDLESARLEVWWLRERLDEVCKALRLFKGYPNLKVALASNCQDIERKKKELDIKGQAIERKKKELEVLEETFRISSKELTAMVAESEKMKETVSDTRTMIKRLYQGRLVDGLL
ncbi:hypothetical protein RJ640_011184 [Escallonia rubra]|uniref:Phospholipase-like protein n=1 Tax=Escallonia rubra TaxID=112253 RepID=A0AA88UQC0_9ASTE|nr:hypothetical protein RJ640_011184 [Escallonia rubra]